MEIDHRLKDRQRPFIKPVRMQPKPPASGISGIVPDVSGRSIWLNHHHVPEMSVQFDRADRFRRRPGADLPDKILDERIFFAASPTQLLAKHHATSICLRDSKDAGVTPL